MIQSDDDFWTIWNIAVEDAPEWRQATVLSGGWYSDAYGFESKEDMKLQALKFSMKICPNYFSLSLSLSSFSLRSKKVSQGFWTASIRVWDRFGVTMFMIEHYYLNKFILFIL